jgi:hypothetical protein
MKHLKDIPRYLIGGTLLSLYFIGIWHSFSKHGGEYGATIWMPPWTVYRGAEYFWHDDFSGVNWEKRLRSDKEVIVGYLAPDGEKGYEVNREKEKFVNEITKYPPDKLNELKKTAKIYIAYSKSVYDDLDIWALSVDSANNSYPPFKLSTRTIAFADSLENNCGVDSKSTNEILVNTFNEAPQRVYSNRGTLKTFAASMMDKYKQQYKELFNENYSE